MSVQVEQPGGQALVKRRVISRAERLQHPALDPPRRHCGHLQETLRFSRTARDPRKDGVGHAERHRCHLSRISDLTGEDLGEEEGIAPRGRIELLKLLCRTRCLLCQCGHSKQR